MKQQAQNTVLQEIQKFLPILSIQTYKHVMFLQKYKDKQFFFLWAQHFQKGVYVTKPSSNAAIWARRIVCLTTNRRVMSHVSLCK
jgi:hypothetical protein